MSRVSTKLGGRQPKRALRGSTGLLTYVHERPVHTAPPCMIDWQLRHLLCFNSTPPEPREKGHVATPLSMAKCAQKWGAEAQHAVAWHAGPSGRAEDRGTADGRHEAFTGLRWLKKLATRSAVARPPRGFWQSTANPHRRASHLHGAMRKRCGDGALQNQLGWSQWPWISKSTHPSAVAAGHRLCRLANKRRHKLGEGHLLGSLAAGAV